MEKTPCHLKAYCYIYNTIIDDITESNYEVINDLILNLVMSHEIRFEKLCPKHQSMCHLFNT